MIFPSVFFPSVFFPISSHLSQSGFPGQTVYVRRDATGRYRQTAHHNRTYHHHNHENREVRRNKTSRTDCYPDLLNLSLQASGYAALIQLMPIIIIIFMSVFSSFLVSDPLYNLQPSAKYNVKRATANLRVPYYVKDSFSTDFTGSLRR